MFNLSVQGAMIIIEFWVTNSISFHVSSIGRNQVCFGSPSLQVQTVLVLMFQVLDCDIEEEPGMFWSPSLQVQTVLVLMFQVLNCDIEEEPGMFWVSLIASTNSISSHVLSIGL